MSNGHVELRAKYHGPMYAQEHIDEGPRSKSEMIRKDKIEQCLPDNVGLQTDRTAAWQPYSALNHVARA